MKSLILARKTINNALIAFLLLATLLLLLPVQTAQAATAAGTTISNQASATYTDATLTSRTATSNTVVTVVQQVASLTLTADGAKTVVAGGQVSYPHTLTNTGNGADTFALTSANNGGFAMTSALFYADADGDGVADNAIPITGTGSLAAAGVFKFVVVATTPGTASAESTNALTVTASSNFDTTVSASNTDTTTISGRAVVNVTKTMDNVTGPSPSGPHTIILNYSNTGAATAANVTLLDALPSGMSYVAGSARWSVTGATVLTDADNSDNQGGIIYDFGVTLPNRVTAVIASVAAGASGSLSFQVNINAGLPAGATAVTANTGQWSYNDGGGEVPAANTNTVQFTVVASNGVDLTANSAGSDALGSGPGPEVAGVVTNAANPGATTRFTLYVANTGTTADSYNLQASTDSTFGALTLPAGWSVVFKDASGAVIGNSATLDPGTNKLLYADVTLPPDAPLGAVDLYFRAISPTTNASDVLHDIVTVNAVRSLTLTADQTGTVIPGGSVVYKHTVTNTGNLLEGDGLLSQSTVASTDSAAGFTSVVYWDKNNDGVLDASDPVVTSFSQLTGGSNGASTAAGLDPGESATLFVKVSAPAAVPGGTVDATTLSVATTGLVNNVAAPATVVSTDTTTVSALGQIALAKAQALDANCDGVADTVFGTGNITTGAIPGACIRYQIIATNTGGGDVNAVVITDTTPANTVYHGTVAAATTVGTISTPANGAAGTVQVNIDTLPPAQSAVLTLGVRINP